MRRNTLNNMIMETIRGTQAYQAVMTDLALEGIIPLGTAESLLGYEIPEYLRSPSGKTAARGVLAKEEPAPKKKFGKDKEQT